MALGLGLLGGAIGAIGGAVQAHEAKKAAARTRRRIRAGIARGESISARSVSGILSTPEYLTAANFIRGFYGIGGRTSRDLRSQLRTEFGGEVLGRGNFDEALNRRFARAEKGAGTNAAFDTLTTDFLKGLRQAQAQRGLIESQAGGAGEAAGLASFRAQLQAEMLPQLFGLAEAPARLRGTYEPLHLQREVSRATGGAAAYGQPSPEAVGPAGILGPALGGFSSGLLGGLSIGSLFGGGEGAAPQQESGYYQPVFGQSPSGRRGGYV